MKNKKLIGIVLILAVASVLIFGKDFGREPAETNGTAVLTNTSENLTEAGTTEKTPEETTEQSTAVPETGPFVPQTEDASPETEASAAEDEEYLCSIAINCEAILDNMDKLDPDKAELVPENGILFAAEGIAFEPGETVFGLLRRTTRENKIHMEFVNSPDGSSYIEGIGNIYEFDCGELSGWLFKVNGEFPGMSASQYELVNGDAVQWVYSCDLGRDVGAGEAGL